MPLRRKVTVFIFITLFLPVSIWGLQFRVLPGYGIVSKSFINSPDSQYMEVGVSESFAYIILTKLPELPPTYVELTEEEVIQFPGLLTALQAFEESKQTEIWYNTTEQEAKSAYRHLSDKYRTSCEGSCTWEGDFKYRDEFYHFGIVVQGDKALPNTTWPSETGIATTPELSCVFVILFFVNMLFVLCLQREMVKTRK